MARVIDVDFNANLARFSSQIDKGVAELNRFQSNADRMAKGVSTAFTTLGAGVVGGALVAFGKNVLDAADSLNDMSVRTGVTVKDLASLRTVAEQNGTSLENVGTALAKLNLSFSQAQGGAKEQAEALGRLGINSSDARERLYQLADAYQKAGGDSRVLADIQKVLGRGYAEMIPLLAQGGEGLRAAAVASESFADTMARLAPHADQFNDNLAQLKTNAAAAAGAFLEILIPSLNSLSGEFAEGIKQAGSFSEALRLFGFGLDPFKTQGENLEALGKRMMVIEQQIRRARDRRDDDTVFELEREREDVIKQIKYLNALKKLNEPAAPGNKQTTPGGNTINLPTGGSKSDPLASLLGSTDIGRLREFEEKVALLNQRFNYGQKDAELYAQAMTKLVESTFANNFKEAANDAEFMAMKEADGAKTTAEWAQNLRDLANVNMSRLKSLLANTDFARLKQDQEDMILLAQAFNEGIVDADGNLKKLSEAEYLDAVKNRLKLVGEEGKETKSIFEEMGIVMVSHLEDAVSGGKDLGDVLKAIEQDIINLIIRLTVMEPLMNGIKGIFGSSGSGSTSGSGGSGFDWGSVISTAIDWIFSANGNAFAGGKVSAFANGGILGPLGGLLNKPTVFPMANGGIGIGGEAGTEAVMPLMRMGNGKLGVYAANDGGGPSVQVNIINNANGTQATANERTDQNGNRIVDVMIEQVKGSIASDISQGRGAIPNALANTYGLNRTAGAY